MRTRHWKYNLNGQRRSSEHAHQSQRMSVPSVLGIQARKTNLMRIISCLHAGTLHEHCRAHRHHA
ncbi:predicted protein [Plenodomus lingam JN3]|uniref:Predicted protein n=1 Tax=Leptosphaeria maculans (strain JN3 / isolate v23.1.3 / race Av1-4-5-6-7-8) TaxID=985895 RepID=E4ZPT5_LEPMJ|nr:predicted protein [Plenodomus lingam JN3]CBX93470.1 predicted protein [Plenodomus lingam JN3]